MFRMKQNQMKLNEADTFGAARNPDGFTRVLGSIHARLTLSISGLAILLLLAVEGPQWTVLAGSMLLLGAGYSAGRTLHLRHAEALAAVHSDAASKVGDLIRLWATSAPVLIRQIETVRKEGDAEVTELARSFGEITRKLDQVMGPTRLPGDNAGGQDAVMGALALGSADLDALVAALGSLQTSKEKIVGDIGVQAARLKENAGEISQIALHTRMVSLNATIEAARAGSAGKPFAVIVADMRQLAIRTAEASDRFSRHAQLLHGMVSAAFQEQTAGDGSVVSIPWARELVQQVVGRFESLTAQLARSIEALERERHDVRDDVSRALMALQFQDRASQILSHVSSSLEAMQADLEVGRWTSMDNREWLQRMARSYSTPEEFDNHGAQRKTTAEPVSAITYF